MIKLVKQNRLAAEQSLEAYACGSCSCRCATCNCSCICNGTPGTPQGTNEAMRAPQTYVAFDASANASSSALYKVILNN